MKYGSYAFDTIVVSTKSPLYQKNAKESVMQCIGFMFNIIFDNVIQ
jgi:hypothetical protein